MKRDYLIHIIVRNTPDSDWYPQSQIMSFSTAINRRMIQAIEDDVCRDFGMSACSVLSFQKLEEN